MNEQKTKRRKGLLLVPDDLAVGAFVAVHSLKRKDDPCYCLGLAGVIRAINLPFVVVQLVCNGNVDTLDVRRHNLMPVTDDFAQAQQQTAGS